ncbi:AfsR/SARP family transcriptional regulator [Actinoplanes solisilvae]|uniref:AfsR/SARP family transcriptional regulator n=1 Tax=Actinoplanes solisilvae TaxID=2486853 RepID=UPI0013E381E5|nr:BTAD domain-containing putative transcriptional regulator [Actinoplanes solisilvae]
MDRQDDLRFCLLGAVRVRRGQADLELGGRQPRTILALLLAEAGAAVSLSDLVDTLWGEDPPVSAVNVVHRHIGVLRRVLEPELPVRAPGHHLIRHASGYRLLIDENSFDLLRFRRLADQARHTQEPAQAVRHYAAALSLWRGRCAAELDRTHPSFLAIEAERWHVTREAADAALRGGPVRLVLPALRQAAVLNPLDEGLQARLLLALAEDGRKAEAMHTFREVRRRLGDELGLGPGPQLVEAYDRLRPRATCSACGR